MTSFEWWKENPQGTEPPAFWIGKVPVRGRVSLAPMAGVSDSPARLLARRAGAALSWTEFVSADRLARGEIAARQHFRFEEAERPILFQIFGAEARSLLRAAEIAQDLGADVVDINMGCSVANVAHRGAGAGMLLDPLRSARIVERIASRLSVPVTVKMRLGYDSRRLVHVVMARHLESAGARMLTVHGRTKEQGYSGKADWRRIAEVKAAVAIPVLGSGDIVDYEGAVAARSCWQVDGVLIGRAAIGNPWAFQPTRAVAPAEVCAVCLDHWRQTPALYGARALTIFRKHLARYILRVPELQAARRLILTEPSAARLEDFLLDPGAALSVAEGEPYACVA